VEISLTPIEWEGIASVELPTHSHRHVDARLPETELASEPVLITPVMEKELRRIKREVDNEEYRD
jgi:hypothetical protein